MPQLLRDNAGDTRVAEDIAALANAYDEAGVVEAADSARQRRHDDLAVLAALLEERRSEEQEPWWPRLLTHVKRYRTYYVVAALVAGVVLFRSPEPLPLVGGDDGANLVIPTADGQPAADTAPVFADPPSFVQTEDVFLPIFGIPAELPAPSEPSPDAEPTPPSDSGLRFAQTGYASSLGGTPVDQEPPSGGLPVEAIAGQVTKYSYARLSGGGEVLRLKALTSEGASLNASQTRVQLCQITTKGWRPNRGTPVTDAPSYAKSCIEGANKSGVWSFTFSSVFDPLHANGWAIVPVLDGNVTFRVTFAPAAV